MESKKDDPDASGDASTAPSPSLTLPSMGPEAFDNFRRDLAKSLEDSTSKPDDAGRIVNQYGRVIFDPNERSPEVEFERLTHFLSECFLKNPENPDMCVESVPDCPPQSAGQVCCPRACRALYKELRAEGAAPFEALAALAMSTCFQTK